MAQIVVEFTDAQLARVLVAAGKYSGLGRDAVPQEIVAFIKNRLKEITLAVELNDAIEQTHVDAKPWDEAAPPPP